MAKKDPIEKPVFNKKTSRALSILMWIGAFSPILLIAAIVYTQNEEDLPSVASLENPPEMLASIVLADDGETELGRYWSVNRTSTKYKDISTHVFDALIATEDERFLEHPGIDFRGVARALLNAGSKGGASTITQQLAKLVFTLENRKRLASLKAQGKENPNASSGLKKRLEEKVIENIIAVRLEERYTKEEIITMYLNQFDFLYNAVGIENAAKVYFNKKAIDLNKQEAAILVGMCKNPGLYNPHGYKVKNYRKIVSKRKNIDLSNVTIAQINEARRSDSARSISRRNQVLYQWKRSSNKDNPALTNQLNQKEYDSLNKLPIIVDYQVVDHKEGARSLF